MFYEVTFKNGKEKRVLIAEAFGIQPAIARAIGKLWGELGLDAAFYEPVKVVKVERPVQK